MATDLGASTGNNARLAGYYRDSSRKAPHNFFTTTTNLWSLTPEGAQPPPPLFTYRGDGRRAGRGHAGGRAPSSRWRRRRCSGCGTRRPAAGSARRTTRPTSMPRASRSHPRTSSSCSCPTARAPADPISPEAVTVGQGEAWVLTDGGVVKGTWSRPDPSKPASPTRRRRPGDRPDAGAHVGRAGPDRRCRPRPCRRRPGRHALPA